MINYSLHLDNYPFIKFNSGYVPVKGFPGYDHVYGHAYGHDLIGPFDQRTGHYGPFGFWANFYHD